MELQYAINNYRQACGIRGIIMRKHVYLNNGWRFYEEYNEEMIKTDSDDGGMTEVGLEFMVRIDHKDGGEAL